MYLVIPTPGGTLIFLCMRKLGLFLGGFKILNFNIFWGFQKNELFLGYEDFADIFWGHHKIGLYLGVIPMHFRVFFFSRYRMRDIFGVAKISNIFRWCLKFLIFFGLGSS